MTEFLSIKIKNYKCFKNEVGFDDLKRVNIIIGRNNTGKSSLLDIIEFATKDGVIDDQATWRSDEEPQLIFSDIITNNAVDKTFPLNRSGGNIGGNHREYGKQFVGREISWIQKKDSTIFLNCKDNGILPSLAKSGRYSNHLPNHIHIPLRGKKFIKVAAERNIVPETHSVSTQISPNGNGITNVIQNFVNRSDLPSELVEIDILNALNDIFSQDVQFSDIVCQLHNSNHWEIYLEEDDKGRIALSKSGSGIKTVISVLANLFLIPAIEKKELSEFIFGFEELENNIHPALLRRLTDYIYRMAVKKQFMFFLTTHSNVLIDKFSRQLDAQILHVTQRRSVSECRTVRTYIDNNGVLDDLDVRASDLLQANGIIWVEGPSDRIYLNRWITLWSNNKFKEGAHYQILFYGGRLLAHLSGDEPNKVDDSISLLNTNRNAIILIDSDKKARQTPINATKLRIEEEFKKLNALCWITKGKEIENYIPKEAVNSFWNLRSSQQVGQYQSFFEHLNNLKRGEGSRFENKKPMLAEKIVPYMSTKNLIGILDIDHMMKDVIMRIEYWNE